MPGLTLQSPAKINLTLRVIRRRDDGYHEIVSIVARVGLADSVYVKARCDGRIAVTADDPVVPSDEQNLAHRAAIALRAQIASGGGGHLGAEIRLHKRIPAGAGLGGGSSNAATVLMALNRLWNVNLPPEQLANIGAAIGSDVPLFLGAPVSLVTGRGELVTPLTPGPPGSVVLVLPGIHLSTPAVYGAWRADGDQPGADEDASSVAGRMADVWSRSDSMAAILAICGNDLTAAARSASREFDGFLSRMQRTAGVPLHMTGSGSALFALYDERGAAELLAHRLRSVGPYRVEVVPFAIPSETG